MKVYRSLTSSTFFIEYDDKYELLFRFSESPLAECGTSRMRHERESKTDWIRKSVPKEGIDLAKASFVLMEEEYKPIFEEAYKETMTPIEIAKMRMEDV